MIFISCSTAEKSEEFSIKKITPFEKIIAIEDFGTFGFKISKKYNISELPDASGAWYGFWTPPEEQNLTEFVAFEIREYPSHAMAIKSGTKYAEEVTGTDGLLKSSEVSWKEGTNDRRKSGFAKGGGGARLRPKYGGYVIFGNLIILCEGVDEEISFGRCKNLVSMMLLNLNED